MVDVLPSQVASVAQVNADKLSSFVHQIITPIILCGLRSRATMTSTLLAVIGDKFEYGSVFFSFLFFKLGNYRNTVNSRGK